MKRQLTWKEYRTIDLCLMALMLAVFEYIIVRAANFWFPDQLYTVSLAATVTSIVFMRWDFWGLIHAVEAGVIFCLFSGATREQYVVYCVGNLFCFPAVLIMKAIGKEKVRKSASGIVIPLLVLFLMQLGRAVVSLAIGAADLSGVIPFFTTDSLSYLFTGVIIWIARRLDGVYEDQKHYLLRINAQEDE